MTKTLSPEVNAVAPASGHRQFRLARFRDLALVPAIIVLLVVGALISPDFLTVDNLTNVLQQQSALMLLVLAEAMILITGKFDLSLESTIGFAPVLAIALVMPTSAHGLGTEWPQWMAIPLCLVIGGLIGAFNGLLILRFQLSAFIVTLGMLITVRGLHVGVSGGSSLFQLPQSFMYLGFEKWFGLAASVWIALIAFVIGSTSDSAERSVQYEGVADMPSGDELRRVQEIYFGVFPDGRERLSWPGVIHVRVKPLWIRYSNFGVQPPLVLEFDAERLRSL